MRMNVRVAMRKSDPIRMINFFNKNLMCIENSINIFLSIVKYVTAKSMKKNLLGVALIAPLGGLLFGYTTAVISSALIFLKSDFALTPLMQGFLVSIILIGALIGASSAGSLSDKIGRRPVILLSDAFFIIGGLFLLLSDELWLLFVGRLVTGVGVGIASVVIPLYIAELAPPNRRGSLVSLNQLAITVGILLAYAVGLIEANQGNWRALFGLALIPALVQFVGMFFLPETRVYVKEAKSSKKQAHFKLLFKKALVPALIVGLGLAILQQITGINTVIYYANQIFDLSGFKAAKGAIWASMSVGIVNVLATIVSLWLIDVVGRRPLLLVGIAGMAAGLIALALSFWFQTGFESIVAVISLMVYVASFAIGLGPVAWLIIAEIYPHQIRGRAMGLAIFANWTFNYIVSLSFLSLIDWLTSSGVFLLYAAICGFAFYFVWRRVPETKGKPLEEIEKFWGSKKKS